MSTREDDAPVLSPLSFRREHLLNNALAVTTVAFWVLVLWYGYTRGLPRPQYGIVFVAGSILIYILKKQTELGVEDRLERLGLWACAVVGVGVPAYVFQNYDVLSTTRVGYALEHEYALAAVFTVVVLYLTYHAFGAAFAVVVVAAIGYAYFGYLIPGLMGHGGVGERQIVNRLVLESSGFFGSITQIVAAWVALFLLYAGLMRGYGAFELIMRLAFRSAKYLRSGVAQSAVVSSLIVGSINGAQTANAAMTGSFTIPLMKESGLRGESAGGIEAVASSGGQIMPPVMGAAAFVMASLVDGVGYIDVVVAGIIPALVFYVSVVVGVHYMSVKQLPSGGVNLDDRIDDIEKGFHPLIEAVRFGLPFGVLLYTLGIAQWTVVSAALYTCAAMVATGVGIPIGLSLIRDGLGTRETTLQAAKDTLSGFKFGAITLAPIAIIIAAVNGIVDLLNATGLPGKLSLALVGIAGGVLLFTVILSMIICLVLGLGMPTVAAYTIVALLIAPTLTGEFAVPTLAAHFFVLYAAILSGITPPIAIAVVVTAGIAESDFWGTAYEALKLGLPLFILPFAFIYNSEIITGGFGPEAAISGGIILLGAISIIHGLNCAARPFGVRSPLSYGVRGGYVALGVLAMVWPTILPRLAIVLVAVLLMAAQTRLPRFQDVGTPAQGD